MEAENPSWREALLNKRLLICVFTGFASGMPLYVLFQLVPARLRDDSLGSREVGFDLSLEPLEGVLVAVDEDDLLR